ncbi:MAG TPA: NAD(+)/NADH kinase [Gaiellaceae bacterium]|nr:NAD(+)/NADH kinase [Gaiellaceae bacterium]
MPSVERIAVVTHGHPELVQQAVARVEALAARLGVEVVADQGRPDVAVVLGGDGTMLRALQRYLDDEVPVVGVNFGRVGFLTAIRPAELEPGLERVLAGDYRVVRLPTLEVEFDHETHVAVNDTVVTSGTIGRIIELGYAIGDEDLGLQRCDGLVLSTPQGSTAYNLSNGGPVLVWGLDAMVLTFVAPHSLHIRPLVVPRGPDVTVTNRSADVPTTVIVDGHAVGSLDSGEDVRIRVGRRQALLATLPENTFFARYAATFGR